MSERESLTAVRDRLQEEFENLTYPVQWGTFMLGRVAQLEAEKKALREGIIRALQIPIGAVLDQHTRFALTDALKEGER